MALGTKYQLLGAIRIFETQMVGPAKTSSLLGVGVLANSTSEGSTLIKAGSHQTTSGVRRCRFRLGELQ